MKEQFKLLLDSLLVEDNGILTDDVIKDIYLIIIQSHINSLDNIDLLSNPFNAKEYFESWSLTEIVKHLEQIHNKEVMYVVDNNGFNNTYGELCVITKKVMPLEKLL
jgi:hypothetical protein